MINYVQTNGSKIRKNQHKLLNQGVGPTQAFTAGKQQRIFEHILPVSGTVLE